MILDERKMVKARIKLSKEVKTNEKRRKIKEKEDIRRGGGRVIPKS